MEKTWLKQKFNISSHDYELCEKGLKRVLLDRGLEIGKDFGNIVRVSIFHGKKCPGLYYTSLN